MNDDRNNATLQSAFNSFLKSNGMRDTYERRVILKAIFESGDRFDTSSVSQLLSRMGTGVSRATIFNTFSLLLDAGLIRRNAFDDGSVYYQLTSHHSSGHRFSTVCTLCGKISDIKSSAFAKEIEHLQFGSFTVGHIALSAYGICSKCNRKINNSRKSSNDQLKLIK